MALLMRWRGDEEAKMTRKFWEQMTLHLCEYIFPTLWKHCLLHYFSEPHTFTPPYLYITSLSPLPKPDSAPASWHTPTSSPELSLNVTLSVKPFLNDLWRVKPFILQASVAPIPVPHLTCCCSSSSLCSVSQSFSLLLFPAPSMIHSQHLIQRNVWIPTLQVENSVFQ